jgi:hypothetical protein
MLRVQGSCFVPRSDGSIAARSRVQLLRVQGFNCCAFKVQCCAFKGSIAARSMFNCCAFKGSIAARSRFNDARSKVQCCAFKGLMLRIQCSIAARSGLMLRVQGLRSSPGM